MLPTSALNVAVARLGPRRRHVEGDERANRRKQAGRFDGVGEAHLVRDQAIGRAYCKYREAISIAYEGCGASPTEQPYQELSAWWIPRRYIGCFDYGHTPAIF